MPQELYHLLCAQSLESCVRVDAEREIASMCPQVARTVSLSEDDRIIARARKEVLAAQEKMARMSLFKDSSAKSQVS